MVVSLAPDTNLSSVGSPRYVWRTSNSAVEYRECRVVAARLSCVEGGPSETPDTEDAEEAEDETGGVDEPGGGVRLRGSSSDELPVSERRDMRAIRGR